MSGGGSSSDSFGGGHWFVGGSAFDCASFDGEATFGGGGN